MSLQFPEPNAYTPRADILRELGQRISNFVALDPDGGLVIHRLLFKLRICRGEAAAGQIVSALAELERKIADRHDEIAVEEARQACLGSIRAFG